MDLSPNVIKRIVKQRMFLFAAIIAGILAILVLIVTNDDSESDAGPGDGSEEPDGGDPDGDAPGDGDSEPGADGGDDGADGSGDSGDAGDAGASGSGSSGSDGDGDDGEDAGGSADGVDGADPPGHGSRCGIEEFLGDLPRFVAKLGDPNLLPPALKGGGPGGLDLIDVGIFGTWDVFPVLTTPLTVVDGFNDAYIPLGNIVRSQCPHLAGDPHVATIDGYRYDFQAVGEYVAMRSNDGDLEVQVRTMPFGDSTRVSMVTGAAFVIDGHTLVIDVAAENVVTFDGEPLDAETAIRTDNGAYILIDDSVAAVLWPDGHTAVSVTRLDRQYLGVYVTLGADYAGEVSGLMGDADGNARNDLALPDGTVLDNDFDSINRILRDAWRVTDDSLFDGPTQFRADLPTGEVQLSGAERAAAREVCVTGGVVVGDLLAECIFDVAVTGDAEFVDAHLEGQRNRTTVANSACGITAAGPASMAGHGPRRTWEIDPVTIAGDRAWTFEPPDLAVPFVQAVVSTPDGGLLVADSQNGALVVDADGTVVRTIDVDPLGDLTPVVVGDAAFVATTHGVAAAGLDGTPCWHLIAHDGEEITSLGHDGERLIVNSLSSRVAIVTAVDPRTGRVLWSVPTEVETATVSTGTPAAIADGLVVVEGGHGSVISLDAETGERVWAYEPEQSDVISAVAIVDGVVYAAGRQSGLTALDLDTGAHRWTTAAPDGGVTLSLAVGSGVAIVVDEWTVMAVDLSTGAVRWVLGEDEPLQAQQPILAGDVVILVASSRQVVLLDVSDGREVLRVDEALDSNAQNSRGAFDQAPVVMGDHLLIFDRSGEMVAFK